MHSVANGYEDSGDEIIASKFDFYSQELRNTSDQFKNTIEFIMKEEKEIQEFFSTEKDVLQDLTIENVTQSLPTALNLFLNNILRIAQSPEEAFRVPVPYLSLDPATAPINDEQDLLYFVLENGYVGYL